MRNLATCHEHIQECMLCTFLMFSITGHHSSGHLTLSTCSLHLWYMGSVDPTANLNSVGRREISCPCQELNPDSSVIQSVAKSLYYAVTALILTHSLALFSAFLKLDERYSISCQIARLKIKMCLYYQIKTEVFYVILKFHKI